MFVVSHSHSVFVVSHSHSMFVVSHSHCMFSDSHSHVHVLLISIITVHSFLSFVQYYVLTISLILVEHYNPMYVHMFVLCVLCRLETSSKLPSTTSLLT